MMSLHLNGDITAEFLYNVAIRYIKQTIIKNFFKTSKKRRKLLNQYLEKEKLPSINKIINVLIDNLYITSKGKDYIIIEVNNNTQIGIYPIKPLIKLIEYGNLEVKGLNFLEKSFNEIRININSINKLYQIGVIR